MLWKTPLTRRVSDETKGTISVISLVVSGIFLITTPCMFLPGEPCHQRMSTLGILSLMGKLFPSTYPTSMPHAGATIILSDLHVWTYSFEFPAGSTKSAGKSGDVLLATMSDHPVVHRLTRRCHTISATTDHVRCSTSLPRTAWRVRSDAQAEDAPDGDTCTTRCEPRVQMCNR